MRRCFAVVVGTILGVAGSDAHSLSGRPGDADYYGPIVISGSDRPALIYEHPRVIGRRSRGEPLYIRVPPGHAKHWQKHCAKYNACDRPVYFIDERWYHEHFAGSGKTHKKGKKAERD